MSRDRVPGDGPKCWCGMQAVWGGYCQAHLGDIGNEATRVRPPKQKLEQRERYLHVVAAIGLTSVGALSEAMTELEQAGFSYNSHGADGVLLPAVSIRENIARIIKLAKRDGLL